VTILSVRDAVTAGCRADERVLDGTMNHFISDQQGEVFNERKGIFGKAWSSWSGPRKIRGSLEMPAY